MATFICSFDEKSGKNAGPSKTKFAFKV